MYAYATAMKNYATFSGRATRAQYWMFVLWFFIFAFVALALDRSLGTGFNSSGGGLFLVIVYLVHFIPALAVTIRRLHDIDRTAWWALVGPVPLVSLILLVFVCTRSTPGQNRFGPPVSAGSISAITSSRESSSSPAVVDQLEKLAGLRASGALDEAEFQKMKSAVLGDVERR